MCLNSVLNVKAVEAAFNQENALVGESLVGAFSVITNLRMELFEALVTVQEHICHYLVRCQQCAREY